MSALASSRPPSSLPHRSARRRLVGRARRSPLDVLARVGYVAHGVVYLLVGTLAARVAVADGNNDGRSDGTLAGPREALGETPALLGNGPLVTVLLALIAIGLFAYAAWRFGQALFDPEDEATRKHGVLTRLSHIVGGVAYSGLALSTVKLAWGRGASKGDSAPEWTARALSLPFGVAIVVGAGVAILVMAVVTLNKVRTQSFLDELDISSVDESKRTFLKQLGQTGYAARALVLAVSGGFVVIAALENDAAQARGLGGALQALAAQPLGQVLLGATALGLAAFGCFEIACAITRRTVTT